MQHVDKLDEGPAIHGPDSVLSARPYHRVVGQDFSLNTSHLNTNINVNL